MKLFGFETDSSPVEQAEHHVRVTQERRDRLVTSLADAERWLNASKSEAANTVLEHGAALLEDHAQNIASQQAGVEALKTALGRAEGELRDAQAALAHEQDQAQRAASVKQIEQLQVDLRGPTTQLLAVIDLLVPLLKRCAALTPDACALASLIEAWHVEMPVAFTTLQTALGLHAGGIRDGRARARLPEPEEIRPRATSTPPKQIGIFPLFDIQWLDAAGQTRTSAKYWDQGLPEATAQKAIACGIVVLSNSDEARKLRSKRGGLGADLDKLVDLDAEHPQPPAPAEPRMMRPYPTPKWTDARQSAAPLSGWIGGARPPTNGEGY